jgi:hypothetical protein
MITKKKKYPVGVYKVHHLDRVLVVAPMKKKLPDLVVLVLPIILKTPPSVVVAITPLLEVIVSLMIGKIPQIIGKMKQLLLVAVLLAHRLPMYHPLEDLKNVVPNLLMI